MISGIVRLATGFSLFFMMNAVAVEQLSSPEQEEIEYLGKVIHPGDRIEDGQLMTVMQFVVRYQLAGRHEDAARICQTLLPQAPNEAYRNLAVSCLIKSAVAAGRFNDAENMLGSQLSDRPPDPKEEQLLYVSKLLDLAQLYEARGFVALSDTVLKKAQGLLEKQISAIPVDLVSSATRERLNEIDQQQLEQLNKRSHELQASYTQSSGGVDEVQQKKMDEALEKVVNDIEAVSQRFFARAFIDGAQTQYLGVLRARWQLQMAMGNDVSAAKILEKIDGLLRVQDKRMLASEALAMSRNFLVKGEPDQARAYVRAAHLAAKRELGFPENAPEPLPSLTLHTGAQALFGTLQRSGVLAEAVASLGRVYLQEGQYVQAERFLRGAVEGVQFAKGRDSEAYVGILADLALVDQAQGRMIEAFDKWREALAIVTARQDEEALLPAGRAVETGKVRERVALGLIELLSADSQVSGVEPAQRNDLVFEAFQLLRSSSVDASMAAAALRRAALDPRQKSLLDQYQTAASELAKLRSSYARTLEERPSAKADPVERQALADSIEDRKGQVTRLAAQLADLSGTGSLALTRRIPREQVIKALGPNEALIQFAFGAQSSYVLVSRQGLQQVGHVSKGRGEIKEKAREILSALTLKGINSEEQLREFPLQSAYDMYLATLSSVAESLQGIQRIYLVADGPLEGLPMGVLLQSPPATSTPVTQYSDLAWLVRQYEIVYLPSATTLAVLRSQGKSIASNDLFGIGDPIIPIGMSVGPNVRGGFVSQLQPVPERPVTSMALLQAGDELKKIRQIIGAEHSTIRLGAEATKAQLLSTPLGQYKVLVFATHGFLASELLEQGEPGLLLSSEPGSKTPTFLTTSDVVQLRLDANLVLLNACDTAGPAGLPGAEALSGLASAFFFAGARSIVASLWPIDDTSANGVAVKMMQIIKDNPDVGTAGALRQAILSLQTEADGIRKHPAFWAPYIIVGDGTVKAFQ